MNFKLYFNLKELSMTRPRANENVLTIHVVLFKKKKKKRKGKKERKENTNVYELQRQ